MLNYLFRHAIIYYGYSNLFQILKFGSAWINCSSNPTDVTAVPSQFKVTKQILLHWQPFRNLKLKYVGSRQAEQLSSRSQPRVVPTVEESVLKTEMSGLESQEEDDPKRILFFKP